MPAHTTTSADKSRAAQAARRQAAQRNAARQGSRARPSAPVVEQASGDDGVIPAQSVVVEQASSPADMAEAPSAPAVGSTATAADEEAHAGVAAHLLNGNANGRDVARQHRQSMAINGRSTPEPARPCGRVRSPGGPAKVEEGTTLSGNPVTGSQVERKTNMTGNESGSCRAITGTEYVGMEQFNRLCGTRPAPNQPAKVGVSITGGGMPVSGTAVGRSARVTGDESGSCHAVTGTDYLGTDSFTEFCNSKGIVKRGSKVMRSQTEHGQITVTGADEARPGRTTGTEAGTRHSVTGSQYADIGVARMTINGPSKVALTHTIAGRPVTGTEVGRSARITGDEQGSCRIITGTEYISNEQFTSICQTRPLPHPAKVNVDHTPHGLPVSGTMLNNTANVTGNEIGSDKVVSGTPYAGIEAPENHASCCDTCAVRKLAEAAGLIAPQGERTGADAAQSLSVAPQPQPSTPHDFSIVSPARAAQRRIQPSGITGNVNTAHHRVTGPVNMGDQWVSGTPEFRHTHITQPRVIEPQPTAPAPLPAPATAPTPAPVSLQQPIAQESELAPSQRITGEGRDGGINITGDNWVRGHQITGTEGRSARGRNPTLRCEARGAAFNAHVNRSLEQPTPAVSGVTGGSGNTHQGAIITVSGGARG